MQDADNWPEAPTPPSGFANRLDFAVHTFNARRAEVALLLVKSADPTRTNIGGDAARLEQDELREGVQLLRRAIGLCVAEKVRSLLRESGTTESAPPFDAEAWAESWINQPLAALGGQRPVDATVSDGGWHAVEEVLDRMRGGIVG